VAYKYKYIGTYLPQCGSSISVLFFYLRVYITLARHWNKHSW